MGPLLFLIYLNDLAKNLSSNLKLFADDNSLFSVGRDLNTSAIEINDDLKKDWSIDSSIENELQSRSFEADTRHKLHHPNIIFNGNPVKKVPTKNIWVCFLIVNLILMNKLKEYLRKLVNLLVWFISSKIFYQDHSFYNSINLLLGLT